MCERAKALAMAVDAIRLILEDRAARGEPIPGRLLHACS